MENANGEQYEQLTLGEPSERRTVGTVRFFRIGERVPKCCQIHYKKILSVIVIGFAAIIAVPIVLKLIQLKKKCESVGCNNGCLIVPERTYCYYGTETDCFDKLCINENDWPDYAGPTYTHISGK